MKFVAVNGSPRRNENTGQLLAKMVEGAESKDAEGELIQLRDLKYSGCVSCFACKRVGGGSYGRCALNDELTEPLRKAQEADVLALGTPFYFGVETAYMRAFMERLWFPVFVYKKENFVLAKPKKGTALVYTMNIPQEAMPAFGKDLRVSAAKERMETLYGSCEVLLSCDTKQFDDYSKYEMEIFDVAEKLRRHKEIFPQELRLAFELGQKLAG